MVIVAQSALEAIGSGLLFLLPALWVVVMGRVLLGILRNRRWPKLATSVARAAGVLPAVWLAAFAALVLLARLKLGEWPYRSRYFSQLGEWPPDIRPCPVGTGDFPYLAVPIFLLWVPALLAPIVFLPAWAESGRIGGRDWRPCAAHILSYALLWAFWMNDPGGFMEWYLD